MGRASLIVKIAKAHTDEWDAERLAALYHRRLPDWQILDPYYLEERTR